MILDEETTALLLMMVFGFVAGYLIRSLKKIRR